MQLDFEFRASETPQARILSVSELTRFVRGAIEGMVGEVWVRGEISNYRRQASGHHYFTLKDSQSQLACVLFGGAARQLRDLTLADGDEIQAFGAMTVYEARGQYQLVVQRIQKAGVGALQAKFEALKQKLAEEGLFDPARKRALPAMPRRVGVVTSPTGAAIRDFLHVLHRRMPSIEVIIHPVRVQGRGASAGIAAAVREFADAPASGLPEVDVIVLTRGGGSIEDLWEFNEEIVARAIANSRIPVVSAVGHEIDFTIADFAADFRAPTPSAAAEILAPDGEDLRRTILNAVGRMARECHQSLRYQNARLDSLGRSALFREPQRILREKQQALDDSRAGMDAAVRRCLDRGRDLLAHSDAVLRARRPVEALAGVRNALIGIERRLGEFPRRRLAEHRERLRACASLLMAYSPDATLARGYTMTLGPDGKLVRAAAGLKAGDSLITRFADGEVESEVRILPRR